MFGIGGFEFVLILLFAFLLFGPDKLPEIGSKVGSLIGKFRAAKSEVDKVVKEEVLDPAGVKNTSDSFEVIQKLAESASKAPTESYAERKARYDKEREAARAAAGVAAGAAGATGAATAADAATQGAKVETAKSPSQSEAAGSTAAGASQSSGKDMSLEDLYAPKRAGE